MHLRSILSIPLGISTLFIRFNPLSRAATTMVADPSKLNGGCLIRTENDGSDRIEFSSHLVELKEAQRNECRMLMTVLHAPLQPLTSNGDTTHPTGFMRDGYCWGSENDPGSHFIGGVVTKEFLEFSKQRGKSGHCDRGLMAGNDLTRAGPSFPGLKDGCRWCLCVQR
jgi:uncharacterized protein (DUF2237 family)